MKRPETWTAAAMVVLGIGLAFWLAIMRPPPTPELPEEPSLASAALSIATPAIRSAVSEPFKFVDPQRGLGVDGLSCGLTAELIEQVPGWVLISVSEPCQVSEIITISYGPIGFEVEIGPRGFYRTLAPMLGPEIDLDVTLGTQRVQSRLETVQPLPLVLGVSWTGDARLSIDVWESGQSVLFGRPGMGKVLRFGMPTGQQSELYVVGSEAFKGPLRVHVEARIGRDRCDEGLSVQTFDTLNGELSVRAAEIGLSGCASDTSALRLRNLLEDVRSRLQ